MNKLSKILLVIIVVLIIALAIMTKLFFNFKETAYMNYTYYQDTLKRVEVLENELNELRNNFSYTENS